MGEQLLIDGVEKELIRLGLTEQALADAALGETVEI